MAKFKVVGAHAVGGVAPGRTVDLDLPDENIAALISAGCVEPVKAAKPATTPKDGE